MKQLLLYEDILDVLKKTPHEIWVPLYASFSEPHQNVCWYSGLIPNDKVTQALENSAWDVSIGDGAPGFMINSEGTHYLSNCDGTKPEPLLIARRFHGLKPDTYEVREEFRLFHNLYPDTKNRKLIRLDESGNDEETIIFEDKLIRGRLHAIRQFLAAKNMHLAIYFDLYRYAPDTLAQLDMKESHETIERDLFQAHRSIVPCDWKKECATFSRLIGKLFIPPLPVEECGIWPYEKKEDFEEFIVGTADGKPVTSTCDEEKLDNYFDKNPGAPHYLTPVFFTRDVLTKYYNQPEKYRVEDGSVFCGNMWNLRLDNDHKKYVIVFLGDLGHLSRQEQRYWRSYNVAPDGGISKTAWERGFEAKFKNPDRADLFLKQRLAQFRKAWEGKYGWPLFKPLGEKDEHFFTALRIPLTNDVISRAIVRHV